MRSRTAFVFAFIISLESPLRTSQRPVNRPGFGRVSAIIQLGETTLAAPYTGKQPMTCMFTPTLGTKARPMRCTRDHLIPDGPKLCSPTTEGDGCPIRQQESTDHVVPTAADSTVTGQRQFVIPVRPRSVQTSHATLDQMAVLSRTERAAVENDGNALILMRKGLCELT